MDYQLIILELVVKALVITLVCSYNIKLGSALALYFFWEIVKDIYSAYRYAKITSAVVNTVKEIEKNKKDEDELH